jgi:Co/Zn/Cd efflux system component
VAGLVSDSFHLTFGCGVLAFSLYAMMVAEQSPSDTYTYGYKRLEVLAAFTNAVRTHSLFSMNTYTIDPLGLSPVSTGITVFGL